MAKFYYYFSLVTKFTTNFITSIVILGKISKCGHDRENISKYIFILFLLDNEFYFLFFYVYFFSN